MDAPWELLVSKNRRTRKRSGLKKRGSKIKPKPSFHIPFEEFPVAKLDDLMAHLEKVKPAGWTIELSETEDAQHVYCMQPLVHILVHSTDEGAAPGSMGIIYQYCLSCKIAVRVL